MVLDGQRGAPLADRPDVVTEARRPEPTVFPPEPFTQRFDDGLCQGLPRGTGQFACEAIGFRVLDAESHMPVYITVYNLYHMAEL